MNAVARYALVSLLVVALGCAGLLGILDTAGRRGVLLAAGIALPVQVVAFGLLARARGDVAGFFTWWGAGIALRILVFGAVGVLSAGFETIDRTALLMALAGFLFVMVLLEPLFLRGGRKEVKTTA